MANPVMYTTSWCGFCRRLKYALSQRGITLDEIDIEQHPEYGARIEEASGGYRTVPTVEVGGRLLVNPSADEVEAALAAAG